MSCKKCEDAQSGEINRTCYRVEDSNLVLRGCDRHLEMAVEKLRLADKVINSGENGDGPESVQKNKMVSEINGCSDCQEVKETGEKASRCRYHQGMAAGYELGKRDGHCQGIHHQQQRRRSKRPGTLKSKK